MTTPPKQKPKPSSNGYVANLPLTKDHLALLLLLLQNAQLPSGKLKVDCGQLQQAVEDLAAPFAQKPDGAD